MPIQKIRVPIGSFSRINFSKEFPKTIKYGVKGVKGDDYLTRKDFYWHKHLDVVSTKDKQKSKGEVNLSAIKALRDSGMTQQDIANNQRISLRSVQYSLATPKTAKDTQNNDKT